MVPAPGSRVRQYEIVSLLGTGGVGRVYRAHDTRLGREVAIKLLASETDDEPSRLIEEARSASSLNHPHVCTIFEVGEHGGQPFIVMEYVEGRTLRDVVPAGGLPWETVVRYGVQIADALSHAHEHGIVHRDLKTANVAVTAEGRVKVLDFGLAARLPPSDAEALTTSNDQPIEATQIAGTLAYMAPELLRGARATPTSDVWALGVLLHEISTGDLPFRSVTQLDLVLAILQEPPAPVPARCPRSLRAIIERCLRKEPARRYRTAAEVMAALEAIDPAADRDESVLEPGRARRRAGWVVATALAALVAVVAFSLLRRPDGIDPPARLANPTQVTSVLGIQNHPTWSPDAERLAFESSQSGNWDIWVKQIGVGEPVNLTAAHRGSDRYPSWSPDGREIAFVSERADGWGLYTMAAVGGSARLVMALPSMSWGAPQWSPDGARIAVAVRDADEVNRIDIVTVSSNAVHAVPLPRHGGDSCFDLSWSPDGSLFAYVTAIDPSAEVTRLWVVAPGDAEPVAVTDGTTNDWSPSWSPDGAHLFFVSNLSGAMDLWRQPVDDDGRPAGDPVRMTVGLGLRAASFSPDRRRLAYAQGRERASNVWRVPVLADRVATWADAEQITSDSAYIQYVDVSPDGRRLVLSSDRAGNQDLWLLALATGAMTQLTSDPAPEWAPQWSPDGSQVVFYSNRSGQRDIWVMPAAGGSARRLTTDPADDVDPKWSPTGGEIAFDSRRSGNWDVWVVSASGGEPRQVTSHPGDDFPATWSPGPLVFQSSRSGSSRMWRVPGDANDGAEPTPMGDGMGGQAHWSPDGTTLYVRRTGPSTGSLPRPPPEEEETVLTGDVWAVESGGGERRVSDLSGRRGQLGWGLSTDGRYVYFTWRDGSTDLWIMDAGP